MREESHAAGMAAKRIARSVSSIPQVSRASAQRALKRREIPYP
jgi:hypothetical protein